MCGYHSDHNEALAAALFLMFLVFFTLLVQFGHQKLHSFFPELRSLQRYVGIWAAAESELAETCPL